MACRHRLRRIAKGDPPRVARCAQAETAAFACRSTTSLTLGVLWSAPSLATTDLLTLHLTRIARDESRVAQSLAQRLIIFHEGARNAVTDRTGLAGNATAIHLHGEIESRGQLHSFERLPHD